MKRRAGIYSGGLSAANKNTGTVITQNAINVLDMRARNNIDRAARIMR